MYIIMCVMMGTIYLKLGYSWQDRCRHVKKEPESMIDNAPFHPITS